MSTPNTPAVLTDDFCLKEFGWTKSQFETIQRTYFQGLSIDEIKIFGHVCKHTKLDPFLKHIYPVMRGNKMTIQTSIDGYRLIAERTGKYSPGREPEFKYGKEGQVLCATAFIKKMTADGTWHEVAATAYSSEYNPGVGPFWKKMPHTMIAKCAEALALRKAFPAELAGVLTQDEMDQADIELLPQQLQNPEPSINHQIKNEPPKLIEEQVADSGKPMTISKDQVQELANLSKNLPQNLKENIKKTFEITMINQIKIDDFEKVKNAIIQIKKLNNIG
jgi:phage recombination protein Bet